VKSLNLYISKNYTKLMEISRKLTSNKYPDYEDLLHEVIVDLYQKEKELLKGLIKRKEIVYYIVKMMINQYHSSTSPFYAKYKRHYKLRKQYFQKHIFNKRYSKNNALKQEGIKLEELKKMEEQLKWIERKCEKLSWFDVSIFKLYYMNNFSLTTMQMATKINRNTLGKSIRIVKKYLQNEQQK